MNTIEIEVDDKMLALVDRRIAFLNLELSDKDQLIKDFQMVVSLHEGERALSHGREKTILSMHDTISMLEQSLEENKYSIYKSVMTRLKRFFMGWVKI